MAKRTRNFNGGIPKEFLTSDFLKVARIPVDPQQTSFEENTQYRFFDELVSVPNTSQIVYKFTSTNAVNVFLRSINIWQGGRKYLVYPADGNETFTGTFTDVSAQIYPTNGNPHAGIDEIPESGVTIEKAVGAGIFSTTSKPRNGTAVITDGNNNRAASAYTANGDRGGVAEGAAFYLVFDHIGSNSATSGLFLIAWEELF